MDPNSLWPPLQRVVALFGPGLTVALVGIILAGALFLVYLVLEFGHQAGRMFIPMVKHILLVLWDETRKDSTAIKVELAFTLIYFLVLFLSFGALLLHGLVIWHTNLNDTFFYALIVSCTLIIAVLCGVSIRLSSRLD